MAHHVLGIDIAASGLKVARFSATIRQLQWQSAETVNYHAEPLTLSAAQDGGSEVTAVSAIPAAPALAYDALAEALGRLPVDAGLCDVYLAMDGLKTAQRSMSFPVTDLKKIEPLLAFELEDQIPRPVDEVLFPFVPSRVEKTHADVLVSVCSKSDVSDRLQHTAARAPRSVLNEPLSLLYWMQNRNEKPTVLIDVGASKTHILLARGPYAAAARTLKDGAHRFDEKLQKSLGLANAEAWRRERDLAALPEAEAKAVDNAFSSLVMAIKQTLAPLRAEFEHAPILLTGGMALQVGICSHLHRALGRSAEDVVELLPLPPELSAVHEGQRYTLAYALAQMGANPGRIPRVDFRRGEFGFRGEASASATRVRGLVLGAVAVGALALLSGITRYSLLRADERKLDDQLRVITKSIIGREMSDYRQALAAMQQSASPERQIVPSSAALDHFATLSTRITGDLDVKVSEMDIRADRITLKCDAPTYEIAEKAQEALQGGECFKQVAVGKQRKSVDGNRVEFSITIDVGCGT